MKYPGTKIQWGATALTRLQWFRPWSPRNFRNMAMEGEENEEVLKDRVEASQEPKKSENVEEKVVTVIEDDKVAEAIKDLEKEDEPKQSENVEEKGVALIEDGTVAEAIKDLRKMEEPKQSENVEEKGVALVEDGMVAGAIKELGEVDSLKGESFASPSDGTEKEISKESEKGGRSSSSSDGKGGESSLMNEERGYFSDLKEYEKKALTELFVVLYLGSEFRHKLVAGMPC